MRLINIARITHQQNDFYKIYTDSIHLITWEYGEPMRGRLTLHLRDEKKGFWWYPNAAILPTMHMIQEKNMPEKIQETCYAEIVRLEGLINKSHRANYRLVGDECFVNGSRKAGWFGC